MCWPGKKKREKREKEGKEIKIPVFSPSCSDEKEEEEGKRMDKRETREIKRRSECRNVLCIKISLPFEFSKRNFVSSRVRLHRSSYLRHVKFSETENCVIVEKLKREKHVIVKFPISSSCIYISK